jgi:uncharacterized protein (TIGR03435 family)
MKNRRLAVLVVASAALGAFVAPALIARSPAAVQVAEPAFEAASIKPDTSNALNRGINMPGDRLEATNVPLHDLIALAYGTGGPPPRRLLDEQIVGGPAWITSELYDVTAKAGSDIPPGAEGASQKLLMLRTLLAERFKVTIHHETRVAPVYALVLARSDGKLGPKLQRSDVDCVAFAAARSGAPPPPLTPGVRPPCNAVIGLGPISMLIAGGQTMASLATLFSRITNRIVTDRTGLSGAFDVDLRFDPEGLPDLGPPGLARPPAPPNSDAPSFFTALQEQLGLKLDTDRGPIDVIVIDHAERPTQD